MQEVVKELLKFSPEILIFTVGLTALFITPVIFIDRNLKNNYTRKDITIDLSDYDLPGYKLSFKVWVHNTKDKVDFTKEFVRLTKE
jgi:hypothetical protein